MIPVCEATLVSTLKHAGCTVLVGVVVVSTLVDSTMSMTAAESVSAHKLSGFSKFVDIASSLLGAGMSGN